ncbi:hypothetical protein C7379_103103 [Hallella colorans]|uniref:Uncharacterized protein n=1 Tax=Hallella colorans TaxID=1703337 RepID=A0A2U0UK01_9BACT|nr:hypothetical protein C7379_103103 [Hallella colorans]
MPIRTPKEKNFDCLYTGKSTKYCLTSNYQNAEIWAYLRTKRQRLANTRNMSVALSRNFEINKKVIHSFQHAVAQA